MNRAAHGVLLLLCCLAAPLFAQEDDGLRKLEEPPLEALTLNDAVAEDVAEATAESNDTDSMPPAEADSPPAPPAPEVASGPDPELEAIQAAFDANADATGTDAGDTTGQSLDAGSLGVFRGYALQSLAGLCIVVALILLLQYLATRYGKNTPLLAGTRLGTVMGRVYLNPKASLHYVKTGGRVLILGVTPQQINLISEFEEEAFNPADAPATSLPTGNVDTVSFLEALKAQSEQLQTPAPVAADDDIASLRGDIQRLQQYLRDETNDKKA